jgi:hypothetical protein
MNVKKRNKILKEALTYTRFSYANYKNDKIPHVKVLDFEYPGQPGQKTYGKRKDILGWNIDYVQGGKNAREEAMRAMDEIDDFADLLAANKKEKYERITTMFPQAADLLRRYIKAYVKGFKVQQNGQWSNMSVRNVLSKVKEK